MTLLELPGVDYPARSNQVAPEDDGPIDSLWRVHQGDARGTAEFLRRIALAAGLGDGPFLGATITSPPYANLVDYGVGNQVGFGQTYDEYLEECASIFDAIYARTKDDGALWIVADSVVQSASGNIPGRLVPLPFDLANAAAKAGWVLRDVIIWRKDRTRPWSNRGRLRNGFEYVLYLVKTNSYKYHVDRLRNVRELKSWWVKYPERHNPWGMAPDNVWEIPIPVQGSWATPELRHACPFPDELVRRMLLLSTDEGDVVFDPFSGSGMVAAVSEAEGRRPLGLELNSEFVETYWKTVRPLVLEAGSSSDESPTSTMTDQLLKLRVLKYPKDVMKQLVRHGVMRSDLQFAAIDVLSLADSPRTSNYGSVACQIVVRNEMTEAAVARAQSELDDALACPPLSRYGIEADVRIVRSADFSLWSATPSSRWPIYRRGKTWFSVGDVSLDELDWVATSALREDIPPIVASVRVQQSSEDES